MSGWNVPETYRPMARPKAQNQQPSMLDGSKRRGGRQFEEMRQMHLRTGPISSASGSAHVTLGRTAVMCAIHGPRQKKGQVTDLTGTLEIDLQVTPFASAKETDVLAGFKSAVSQALDGVVLLEQYPKSTIDICIKVLDDDGGALACCIIAASLALADAGIAMTDIVAAASVHMVPNTPLLLDCDAFEEKLMPRDAGALNVAMTHRHGMLSLLQSQGPIPPRQMELMLELALASVKVIGEQMRKCLEEAHQQKQKKRKLK